MNEKKANLVVRLITAWGVSLIGALVVWMLVLLSGAPGAFGVIYSLLFLLVIGIGFTYKAFLRYYLT